MKSIDPIRFQLESNFHQNLPMTHIINPPKSLSKSTLDPNNSKLVIGKAARRHGNIGTLARGEGRQLGEIGYDRYWWLTLMAKSERGKERERDREKMRG